MEVKKFAVSVQWGKGMHYFTATDLDTLAEAKRAATKASEHAWFTHNKRLTKYPGASPTTHIWQHIETITSE